MSAKVYALDGQNAESLCCLGVQFEDEMDFKLDVDEFEHSCEEMLANVEGNVGPVSCLDKLSELEFSSKVAERSWEGDRDRWGWWLGQ